MWDVGSYCVLVSVTCDLKENSRRSSMRGESFYRPRERGDRERELDIRAK